MAQFSMVRIEQTHSESPAPASPDEAVIKQSRAQRHRLFRQHVETCPLCVHEHDDMCPTGYRLLRACLD